jgi:hypothetical protein
VRLKRRVDDTTERTNAGIATGKRKDGKNEIA